MYWNSVPSKSGTGEKATASAAVTCARRAPPSSLCHEAGENDDRGLRQHGEEPQADHGEPEERETNALDERREWRIGDESPVEMARVAEELQLVAMKAVAAVGEQVQEGDGGGDGEEDRDVARMRSRIDALAVGAGSG